MEEHGIPLVYAFIIYQHLNLRKLTYFTYMQKSGYFGIKNKRREKNICNA